MNKKLAAIVLGTLLIGTTGAALAHDDWNRGEAHWREYQSWRDHDGYRDPPRGWEHRHHHHDWHDWHTPRYLVPVPAPVPYYRPEAYPVPVPVPHDDGVTVILRGRF